jgi:hypothetical protein
LVSPIFVLGVPVAEGEYGIGQARSIALPGENVDEDGTIFPPFKTTLLHFHASPSCWTRDERETPPQNAANHLI